MVTTKKFYVIDLQLINGLSDLFASYLSIAAIRSIVGEFDIWVRTKLACILDFEDEIKEAVGLVFALDELIMAMNLRIDLEESDRARVEKFTTYDVAPKDRFVDDVLDLDGGAGSKSGLKVRNRKLIKKRILKKKLSSKTRQNYEDIANEV